MAKRRAIETGGFAPIPEAFEPGAAPMLQWVAVADLAVDEAYQRPIVGAGRTNVRRIAREFRWAMFAPVIVSPIEGGKYAIVDGQHRTMAAALRGIESVPCQVVVADAQTQAAAFKAINGQVTAVSTLTLHRAALAAGEAEALAIDAVARAAGVTILPYPKHPDELKAGETLALGVLRRSLLDYGRELVVTALTCITGTVNNRPGVVCAAIVHALVAVLAERRAWRGDPLWAAVGEIDLAVELEEARVTRRERNTPLWRVLADRLLERLGEALDEEPPAAAEGLSGDGFERATEAHFVARKRAKNVPWPHIAQQLGVSIVDLWRRHDPEFHG